MALSARNRTILYEHFNQTIQDPEAVEQMLSYFPARDVEEPLTREYLDARLAEMQLSMEVNIERRLMERFDLDRRFDQIDKRFDQIDGRFGQVDKRMDQVDDRFGQVDKRMDQVDDRFSQVDDRFDQVDKRFDQIDKRMDQADKRMDRLEDRLAKVEDRLTAVEVGMADGFRSMQRWVIGTGLSLAGVVVAAAGVIISAG